jgi:hypothetical protein
MEGDMKVKRCRKLSHQCAVYCELIYDFTASGVLE